MSAILESINPLRDKKGWDELVNSMPTASIFHSSAWARVLASTYGFQPFYFAKITGDKPQTLIPMMEVNSILTGKRGVSLPFSDHCEVLVNQDSPGTVPLKEITEIGRKRKWRYVELRSNTGVIDDAPSSACFIGHKLKLAEEEGLFDRLRASTKRNINKARREGVKVAIHDTFDSIQEYYRLHCMTRKKHGTPPQPITFFKNIYEHIIQKKLGHVVLASHEGKVISGNIYFHFNKEAFYKFGASDMAFQHTRASNLVMWEAIRWYSSKGYRSLCFGRTDPSNHGLLQYKEGWGAEKISLNYFKYDLKRECFCPPNRGHSKGLSISRSVLRYMPLPVLRAIGSLLYKHTA